MFFLVQAVVLDLSSVVNCNLEVDYLLSGIGNILRLRRGTR